MAVFDRNTDYDFFLHERFAKVQRSSFPLGRLRYHNLDVGAVIPVDYFRTNPGEHFKLSYDYMLETLPLAVQPLNRHRLFISYWYCKNSDLWKGWKTMITQGRKGTIEKVVPRVDLSKSVKVKTVSGDYENRYYNGVNSLANYLGVPAFGVQKVNPSRPDSGSYHQYLLSQTDDDDTMLTGYNLYKRPSALPFVFYQKIMKAYKLPNNLLQNNPNYFPEEGDDDWLLSYGDDSADNNILFNTQTFLADESAYCSEVPQDDEHDYCNLLQLRYDMWRGDPFTSALPWLQRGVAPTLETAFDEQFFLDNATISPMPSELDPESDTEDPVPIQMTLTHTSGSDLNSKMILTTRNYFSNNQYNKVRIGGSSSANLGVSANQLRSLLALTVWQERNARTDGNYNSLVRVHFRTDPNSEEHVPVYIGGSSHDIYFREVIQSNPTSETPAGTKVSNGQSLDGSYVSDFRAPDYGYIMVLASIVPDVVYNQGVERDLTATTFSDFYFPEFANLQPEPIKQQEIYVGVDDDENNRLFGYQERDWEYKVRLNRASGLLSLPPNTDRLFSSYTQSRVFDKTPNLSSNFVVMAPETVRRDMLAYPSQPAFILTFNSRVHAVRPIPYESEPETFGF